MSTVPPPPQARQQSHWSPNQQAARARIVAEEGGLTKSTVHYYVRDANELVDLAVLTFMERLARQTRLRMDEAPDGRGALGVLVRMFMNRDERDITLQDPTLWAAYTAHAYGRGAIGELVACFEQFSALFETALERCGAPDPHHRGRSVYHYLLGAVQRNIVQPLPHDEIAHAVSALCGISLDPFGTLS
jgi:AcrR family transcriptional regulator